MSHPDFDRLTAWIHGLLDSSESETVRSHVAGCPDCGQKAGDLGHEADVLRSAIASPERLAALKDRLVRMAAGPGRPRPAGLLWQIPLAAAVLFGLFTVFLSPGQKHRLTSGRLALEDGREVGAPFDLAASGSWRGRALGPASLQLSDRTTVQLNPGSRLGLQGKGERGIEVDLVSGTAAFVVAPERRRLSIRSSSGLVESAEGRFVVKVVDEDEGGTSMKSMLAGTLVTVLAGSVSLSNADGKVSAGPGQSVVMAAWESPLLVADPQDAETLLKRLEQLAARVAKLEDQLVHLEARNRELKEQLKGTGAAWSVNPGAGGWRMMPGAAAPGSPVIIELEERPGQPKSEPRKERKE